MIRQPEFVTNDFAELIIERVKSSKPHELLDKVKFNEIEDGTCIQMMHLGPYNNEPQSFAQMEEFAKDLKLERKSKVLREIYLSDVRRAAPEKLKTVLRFQVTGELI